MKTTKNSFCRERECGWEHSSNVDCWSGGYYPTNCSSSNLLAHVSRAVVKREKETQLWELILDEDNT